MLSTSVSLMMMMYDGDDVRCVVFHDDDVDGAQSPAQFSCEKKKEAENTSFICL